LNKLALPGPVWIASDTHLGPHAPQTQKAFLAFLEQARRHAGALLLCGDIFEAWIGDDLATDQPPVWLAQLVGALQETSAHIPVYLMRGNRDFLLGKHFANAVGARLLNDQTLLDTAAGLVLLSHGDEYCTDDRAYQRLRRWVRKPWVQKLFLGLSLTTRKRIAAWARSRSKRSTAGKQMTLLDVNQQAISTAFERSGSCLMVHGHTHRPAVHTYELNGKTCVRHVLTDWDFDCPGQHRGGWLLIDEKGIRPCQASNSSSN
jgi:UDP-2,3-diacylglucosamine hydrolase